MALFGLASTACLTEHLSHEVCIDCPCIAVARRELHSVSIDVLEVFCVDLTRVIGQKATTTVELNPHEGTSKGTVNVLGLPSISTVAVTW